MSTNVPTFTIPHYEENAEKFQPLAKMKNNSFSKFSDLFFVLSVISMIILGCLALFSLFSLSSIEGIPQASDGFPASLAVSFIVLFVLLFSLMVSLFIYGGPYARKVEKITTPIVKDLDLVEKLEYWLKANYGLRLKWPLSDAVVQDLLINNAVTPKKRVYVNLIQDRDADVEIKFSGLFVEKAPGVFELQKASINDTTESVYFTAIPEAGREKATS